MADETRRLAEFAANLTLADVPEAVVERAKLLLLDTVGIAVRARWDSESTEPMIRAVEALGLSGGSAHVFGDPAGYAPPGAALLNAALAHSLDFDDTHARGSIHTGAALMPAAFTAAEMCGASGRDVLAAIIAGLEIVSRLSMALVPADHYDRGLHPSATCGAFASAAAAGRVLGLSAAQMENAFGIALSQTAGSLQFLENGAWTKRFQLGNAAMAGVIAATHAQYGYVGAAQAIEGRYAFLHAYAPNPAPERAIEGLGVQWETLLIGVKPYPSCRYSHAAMDACAAWAREESHDWTAIDAVQIGLQRKGIDIIGVPENKKRDVKSAVDGQFSMHFCAAVALREGGMGWDDYDRHLGDTDTAALIEKISVVHDERVENEYPQNMSGAVRIACKDGTVHEDFIIVPKGEPENFVSAGGLRAKFSALVQPYLGTAGEAALYEAVMSIDAGGVAAIFQHAQCNPALAAAGED